MTKRAATICHSSLPKVYADFFTNVQIVRTNLRAFGGFGARLHVWHAAVHTVAANLRTRRAGRPMGGRHCPFGKRVSVSGERESNLLLFPLVARDYNSWVYIMTNQHDAVLYIGMTNSLGRRISQHRSGRNSRFYR